MEDTTVTIIGMIIAIIMMLVVPLILLADRTDDISQLVVDTATSEFVEDVIKTGQITSQRYQEFLNALASSGNTYEIDMEVKILDENTSKKITDVQGNEGKIGSNTYYSIFTSQIEEKLAESEAQKFLLKQGDGISIIVRNSSSTFSQALKSFYYSADGEDIHIIVATATGTVAINGMT